MSKQYKISITLIGEDGEFSDERVVESDDSSIDIIANLKKYLTTEYGECSVCLDPLRSEGEVWHLLCSHTFHIKCLVGQRKCPLCRKTIDVNSKPMAPRPLPPAASAASPPPINTDYSSIRPSGRELRPGYSGMVGFNRPTGHVENTTARNVVDSIQNLVSVFTNPSASASASAPQLTQDQIWERHLQRLRELDIDVFYDAEDARLSQLERFTRMRQEAREQHANEVHRHLDSDFIREEDQYLQSQRVLAARRAEQESRESRPSFVQNRQWSLNGVRQQNARPIESVAQTRDLSRQIIQDGSDQLRRERRKAEIQKEFDDNITHLHRNLQYKGARLSLDEYKTLVTAHISRYEIILLNNYMRRVDAVYTVLNANVTQINLTDNITQELRIPFAPKTIIKCILRVMLQKWHEGVRIDRRWFGTLIGKFGYHVALPFTEFIDENELSPGMVHHVHSIMRDLHIA